MTDARNTPSVVAAAGLRFAEAVLPGHPDKLADQIADALVDLALQVDDRAIVRIEVAVHDHRCHVNGRIHTAGAALDRALVEATVRRVYRSAGFGVAFPGVGDGQDFQRPHPDDVQVDLACEIAVADTDEQALRELSDDQAIHVGHAIGTPETDWLPMEQHLVLVLRDALLQLTATDRSLGAGPDGKLLIALRALPTVRPGFARWVPVWIVTSVQHVAAASVVKLERAVRDLYTGVLVAESARMPDLLAPPPADFVVGVNQAGPFVEGGPINDNGQTGRKLVMDFYGPNVGIGGGALSGKDPWRLDRAGALRARQVAVALVETGFVSEARITLAWGPRDERPSGVVIEADGRVQPADVVARWVAKFDLSLAGTHRELGLAHVNWENTAQAGAFRATSLIHDRVPSVPCATPGSA
ncbi:MAG TPA: methionine adenosyltransferase domain-containing protein [Gemmatimonadaceae bacterium]|nr:methionine adenosyltransferase domain-containing protein [Gemmatimonadaceae bacterium]